MERRYEYFTVGEAGPPWTSMSEKSMARVMKAVLITGSSIQSTYIQQIQYAPRTSVYYSVRIPADKVDQFIDVCGYKLTRHPDIQLGMDVVKSVKAVIYDVEDKP